MVEQSRFLKYVVFLILYTAIPDKPEPEIKISFVLTFEP